MVGTWRWNVALDAVGTLSATREHQIFLVSKKNWHKNRYSNIFRYYAQHENTKSFFVWTKNTETENKMIKQNWKLNKNSQTELNQKNWIKKYKLNQKQDKKTKYSLQSTNNIFGCLSLVPVYLKIHHYIYISLSVILVLVCLYHLCPVFL